MPKRKASFYGVRVGNNPGVYEDWEDCKRQVIGFPGNEYKSFPTRSEAEDYVQKFLQGSTTRENGRILIKEDTKNGSSASNFKEKTAELLPEESVITKKETNLALQLSDVDRSKLVKLIVEENGEHFFLFNSLKDYDLYFESLAQSNHQDEDILGHETPKVCAKIPEDNVIFEGVETLEKKDAEGVVPGVYQIEFDGASKGNPGRAGAGALIRCPHGCVVAELAEFLGNKTNNVAEYKSLILGLNAALSMGVRRIRAQGDSKLVCSQINGAWKVENEKLIPLVEEVKRLQRSFEEFSLAHVRREFNSQADALANDAVLLGEPQPIRKTIRAIPQCCIHG